MKREWRRGDVAMVDGRVAFVWIESGDVEASFLYIDHDGDPCSVWAYAADARPVVVIDPEDREQVERLLAAYATTPSVDRVEALQAALREFADPRPPKPEEPEEPTGWLAVIEARDGVQWYRWSIRPGDRDRAWISAMDEGRCYPTAYADIDAVRVLSPGVTE